MTRRETAIKAAINQMNGSGFAVWIEVLNTLIDQAEAGALKETIPTHRVGLNAVSDPGAE